MGLLRWVRDIRDRRRVERLRKREAAFRADPKLEYQIETWAELRRAMKTVKAIQPKPPSKIVVFLKKEHQEYQRMMRHLAELLRNNMRFKL